MHDKNHSIMTGFIKFLLSMRFMTILVFVFLSAIAIATFLESSYGYSDLSVSRYFVYGAKWFEWLLFFLFINLINNIFKYKMFSLKKIGSLIFHVAFLIIIIGSFITRNYGYEGMMSVREGSASDRLLSTETYLQIRVDDKVKQYSQNIPLLFTGALNEAKADFHKTLSKVGLGGLSDDHVDVHAGFNFPDESHFVEISYHNFLPGLFEKDTLQEVENGSSFLHIVTVGEAGRQNNYIGDGMVLNDKGVIISVNKQTDAAVNIIMTDSGEFVQSPFDIEYLVMADQSNGTIPRDTLVPFLPRRLYILNGVQFAYSQRLDNMAFVKTKTLNHEEGIDVLQVNVKDGGQDTIINLSGGSGIFPRFNNFSLNGLNYHLCFGSKIIKIPFFIHLRDFQQEKYPGTDNPSSYASEVTLVDTIKDAKFDHRIFMNNVLDYGGYRFFQSSFDPDEKGTILSVNHDAIGTNVTYLGYALMALGMFISIFAPGSRFKFLQSKADGIRLKREGITILLPLFMLTSFVGYSAEDSSYYEPVSAEHAEKFAKLILQDFEGRFMPVHTMAENILKKINRSKTYNGLSATQVFIGLHTDFAYWFEQPLVYVSGDSTRRILGIEGKRAKMSDFYDQETGYKLSSYAKAALKKAPGVRNAFEKDFIKTDERFNVLRGVVMGYWLKIFPMKDDPKDTWYAPADNLGNLHGNDSTFVSGIMTLYIYEVKHAIESGNWLGADSVVILLDKYQHGAGNNAIMPTQGKIEWEIFYNKADFFKRLNYSYLLMGLLLLIVQFIKLFKPSVKVGLFNKIGVVIFLALAAIHAFGLGLRWYLSGHAPWSDGYEAIIFIAFVTVVAGLIFAKNNKIILGASGILAWLLLFVAHLSNMDPEISNLVPVLKSYWLKIHVAVITGSYAFLGLSAVLGIINLFIEIFKTKETKKQMSLTAKELRYGSEMVMTIGVFMLTIGTFLGGVWANESWGRYWGWDAKETWALVSILVYTIILHFRFIPGLKSDFVFNAASIWGYGSIIMTFYGVNFYLSGLHSYATGDPLPIPTWVYVTVVMFILLSVTAYIRKRRVL